MIVYSTKQRVRPGCPGAPIDSATKTRDHRRLGCARRLILARAGPVQKWLDFTDPSGSSGSSDWPGCPDSLGSSGCPIQRIDRAVGSGRAEVKITSTFAIQSSGLYGLMGQRSLGRLQQWRGGRHRHLPPWRSTGCERQPRASSTSLCSYLLASRCWPAQRYNTISSVAKEPYSLNVIFV